MPPSILPRDLVARNLAIAPSVLVRYEARGLVRTVRVGDIEGYEPGEIRRLWSIVSLQRDLGINLAGVEAILALRARMDEQHRRLRALAAEVRTTLDQPTEADADA